MHCPLSSAEADPAIKGVTIGVTLGVRLMRADWSSSNYTAKENFIIEITKLWAHRNTWAPAETFAWDRTNRKIESKPPQKRNARYEIILVTVKRTVVCLQLKMSNTRQEQLEMTHSQHACVSVLAKQWLELTGLP